MTVPTRGLGIKPRGPKHFAEAADQTHHVGRGDAAVEVDLTGVDLLDQVLRADHVGAGGLGLVGLGAAREHADPHRASGAVRQRHHAADHLVGMLGIDAEVHRDLDGLIELRLGPLLDHLHGFRERIGLGGVDAFTGSFCALSDCHCPYPFTSRPIERAEPSTIFMAASMVVQFKSFIFCSAISLT